MVWSINTFVFHLWNMDELLTKLWKALILAINAVCSGVVYKYTLSVKSEFGQLDWYMNPTTGTGSGAHLAFTR